MKLYKYNQYDSLGSLNLMLLMTFIPVVTVTLQEVRYDTLGSKK